MKNFAKGIRILTRPPIFAAILCTLLYCLQRDSFASLTNYLSAIFFLALLPMLAYPVAAIIPPLRRKGREGQRNLAIVFSMVGYIGSFLVAMLNGGAPIEKVIMGTYLISGCVLAVCTCLRFKASGHTCGCSGPIAALSLFINPWFLLGYLLITPVAWSSLKLKEHTGGQLLAGSIVPVLAILFCCTQFL